jgi:hypothetical protein
MAAIGVGSDCLVFKNGVHEVKKQRRVGYDENDDQDIRDSFQREINFSQET